MFNWTTTTFINALPHMTVENEGKRSEALRIGNKLFEKRWVESIRKAEGHDYELCEATLDLAAVKAAIAQHDSDHETVTTVARLYIYVGLEGSEESIYANDWYRKGMPLSISFPVDKSDKGEEKMASYIIDNVKKFNVFTKVKKVLDVNYKQTGVDEETGKPTYDKTKLTIKGTHEYQRLQKIAILVGDNSISGEETALINWTLSEAQWHETGKVEDGADKAGYRAKTGVTLVQRGVNGFGTYSQLVKDLSLPTAAHTHWTSVTKDERPVIGNVYTQYIITYYAPSTANPSFTAVGNRSMSETTHVFWVKSGLVEKWEQELVKLDPDGGTLNSNPTTVIDYTSEEKEDVKRYENIKSSLLED